MAELIKTTDFKGKQVFICNCKFEEKEIPKSAGFIWNKIVANKWATNYLDTALKLYQFANGALKEELETIYQEKQTKINNSKASNSNVNLLCPDGLQYKPYQKAGIIGMMNNQNTLLADDKGLGKTIQIIGLINNDPKLQKILIICPSSIKYNWQNEINTWLINHETYQTIIIEGEKAEININKDKFIIILNYDIFSHYFDLLRSIEFDLLVCDEAHKLKNGKALRTKKILGYYDSKEKIAIPGIVNNCSKYIMATASPIQNKTMEIFPILHVLDPKNFFNPITFGKRYCAGVQTRYGWDFTGFSHLDELYLKLRETVMIRRKKTDVLPELPAKTRSIKVLPNSKLCRKELDILGIDLDKINKDNVQYYINIITSRFEEFSSARHELGLEKIPFAIEEIEDQMESGVEKLVVFGHHQDVIDQVYQQFKDISIKIIGGMDAKKKTEAINQFQTNPNIKIAFCSIRACGEGITLTAACDELFIESDPVPEVNGQAEDRCHRIGQKNNVTITYMAFNRSLDGRILELTLKKEETIDQALDQSVEIPIIEQNIIEKVKNNETIINQQKDQTIQIKQKTDNQQTQDQELSPEIKSAILKSLKILASVCDGARQKDDSGFNGMDTRFGHDLAARSFLTNRQAIAAKKMIRKYKRQIPEDLYQIIYG